MSVFAQFTAKKNEDAESEDTKAPQDHEIVLNASGGADEKAEEKSSGWSWVSWRNLGWGSLADLVSGPKSGGYHESDDSPDKGVTALLAALYYVFLIIVLIFVIDQACSEEPKLSKFNPFVS